MSRTDYDVKDLGLAKSGLDRIEWAAQEMPVLRSIRERFEKQRPLEGARIAACLHITTETANLLVTLQAGGATVACCASNPLSTQDDVAAALVAEHGISAFCIKGEDRDTYYRHIHSVLDIRPNITMDDGADTVGVLHSDRQELLPGILGGTEETTTGVIRLRAMAKEGVLRYPIIAVNDAETKHQFDNRYGTGQSTVDGIMRATNLLLAGRVVVVAGYGWCGKGVASRARGLGAHVIVTEIDPVRGIEAVMDGFPVMSMDKAAEIGDLFITVTGNCDVLDEQDFRRMKSGAVMANSGHFNDEIDIPALERLSVAKRRVREYVDEYLMEDGRKLYLLGEGRLINLAAAEGHPASVMDMSFANQALCAEYIYRNASSLEKRVYPVPLDIDKEIARIKLASLGHTLDALTPKQEQYLVSWNLGT